MTTWRECLKDLDIDPESVIAWTSNDEMSKKQPSWLDTEFPSGYGSESGTPFMAWTQDHVIFCAMYDGAEWLEKIPRNPTSFAPQHIGG